MKITFIGWVCVWLVISLGFARCADPGQQSFAWYASDGPFISVYTPEGLSVPLFLSQIDHYSMVTIPLPFEVLLGLEYPFTFTCTSEDSRRDSVLTLMTDNEFTFSANYVDAVTLFLYLQTHNVTLQM